MKKKKRRSRLLSTAANSEQWRVIEQQRHTAMACTLTDGSEICPTAANLWLIYKHLKQQLFVFGHVIYAFVRWVIIGCISFVENILALTVLVIWVSAEGSKTLTTHATRMLPSDLLISGSIIGLPHRFMWNSELQKWEGIDQGVCQTGHAQD